MTLESKQNLISAPIDRSRWKEPPHAQEHTAETTTSYTESYGVKTICMVRNMLMRCVSSTSVHLFEEHLPTLTHSFRSDNQKVLVSKQKVSILYPSRSVFTPYDSIDLVEVVWGALDPLVVGVASPATCMCPSLAPLVRVVCLVSPLALLTLGEQCPYNQGSSI